MSRDEQVAAKDRWPDGSADECPKCGFLHAYDRSCEDRASSAATTEPTYADPYTRIAWLHGEIERLRDRAVCSGCGGDVAESGACIAECGEGEMIPASDLPLALRAMREQRDEWRQEAMSL